jgi:hypothetical protein
MFRVFAFSIYCSAKSHRSRPSNRLYQRMLALDEEEALAIVENTRKKNPVDAAMDEVVLPALVNADVDDRKGLVSEETARNACNFSGICWTS